MQKRLIIAVILIISMAITGTALAASVLFSDVPAKHWAYDAVNKLVKAGIIDGYGDGTFRGDNTITRYEFALATTKALQKYDAADAANKASIDKLSAELANELSTLSTRVTKVENNLGKFKLNGEFKVRYSWAEDPAALSKWLGMYAGNNNIAKRQKVQTKDGFKLNITNEIDKNLSVFTSLVVTGGATGYLPLTNTNYQGGSYNPGGGISMDAMFATYKAPEGTVYKFGRNYLTVGQGLLWDVAHSDGLQVTFGNKLRTMVGFQSFISKKWYFADMKYNVNDKLQLTAGHYNDKDKQWYYYSQEGYLYYV